MSRPDSPIKPSQFDDETCKKLKAILMKEKRLNKEKDKEIIDLNNVLSSKEDENNKLIDQIKRLSENIELSNDSKEDLIIKEQLESFNEKLKDNLTQITSKYDKLFQQINLDDNILNNFDVLLEVLSICDKEFQSKSVLQDGLDKITYKCYDLEEKYSRKDEQIRHLEEIIEESRNISRELENERDQLQNELVDIRQRQQEKETYYEDECREIRRNYQDFQEKSSKESENLKRLVEELSNNNKETEEKSVSCDNFQLEDLKSELDKLKQENVRFKNENEAKSQDLEELNSKFLILKSSNDDKDSCIDVLQKKIIKNEYKDIVDELCNICSTNDCIKLVQNVSNMKSELNQLKYELTDKINEIDNYSKNIDDMTAELNITQSKLEDKSLISVEDVKLKEENENLNMICSLDTLEVVKLLNHNSVEDLIEDYKTLKKMLVDLEANSKYTVLIEKICKILNVDDDNFVLNEIDEIIKENNNLSSKFKRISWDTIISLLNIEDVVDEILIIDELNRYCDEKSGELIEKSLENQKTRALITEICQILELDDENKLEERIKDLSKESKDFQCKYSERIKTLLNITEDFNVCLLIEELINHYEINSKKIECLDLNNQQIMQMVPEISEKVELLENSLAKKDYSSLISEICQILSIENPQDLTKRLCILKEEFDFMKLSLNEERQTMVNNYEEKILELNKELAKALKSESQSNLLNLEMEEVNRTLMHLKRQLESKDLQIQQLESLPRENALLIEQIEEIKKTKEALELKSTKMKQMLVKNKKELGEFKAELTRNQKTNSELKADLNSKIDELDHCKVQMSTTLVERESDFHALTNKYEKSCALLRNKETQLTRLKQQLNEQSSQLKLLNEEYNNYKIKAQSVFTSQHSSSNKTSHMSDFFHESSTLDDSTANIKATNQIPAQTNTIEILESKIDQLQVDIIELQNLLNLANQSNNKLKIETSNWIEKYKILLKEKNEAVKNIQMTLDTNQMDYDNQTQYLKNQINELQSNNESLTVKYDQAAASQSDYENQMKQLNKTIDELQLANDKVEQEIWQMKQQRNSLTVNTSLTNQIKVLNNHMINESNSGKPLTERQQGEGMESQMPPSVLSNHRSGAVVDGVNSNNQSSQSPQKSSRRKFIPFEELVMSSTTSTDNSLGVVSPIKSNPLSPMSPGNLSLHQSTEQEQDTGYPMFHVKLNEMKHQIVQQQQQIDSLLQQYNESEALLQKFTDQNDMLKQEIRRLEANEDRYNKLSNNTSYEYLKNVLIKFLDYHNTRSDERSHLIKVLTTLLNLSQSEVQLLQSTNHNTDINHTNENQSASYWSNYLGWTGLK